MLGELHIKNFAVIKDISVNFASGLNVVSGDEGTGKSLIVDALSLIMGARAPSGLIRSGAKSARVEAIFWLAEQSSLKVSSILEENGVEPECNGMLLISRDFQEGGKSVARLNNRAVPLSVVKQVGRYLMDIHGQMEYLSLMDAGNQLLLVDAFGGLNDMRMTLRRQVEELREVGREIASMDDTDKQSYIDMLQYQIDEIERSKIESVDEEDLMSEREVLRRAEAITSSCLTAYANLYSDERSISVLLHKTMTALRGVTSADKQLAGHYEKVESMLMNVEETARELLAFAESVEDNGGKLEEIERQVDTITSLKRKYGNTLEGIIAFRAKSCAELIKIENLQERKAGLSARHQELKAEAARAAAELSLARRNAAERLVKLVNEELNEIGMEWAKFDIKLSRKEDQDGFALSGGKAYAFTSEGIDRIEFQVATNPGEPMRPMAVIASGGETSRIILAVKSALKTADPIPTLVFDEIDMGVGGRSADSVGRKLASLAAYHQVLCITHLPQIACFGDIHFKLIKEIDAGRAATRIEQVEGNHRVRELAAMLGSERNGSAMLKGAEALVKNAEKWKDGVRELVQVG
jgi:DNA repair protein RecN (Recombination protein N)